MDISNYEITNIHRGKPELGEDEKLIYAYLMDRIMGEIVYRGVLDSVVQYVHELSLQ